MIKLNAPAARDLTKKALLDGKLAGSLRELGSMLSDQIEGQALLGCTHVAVSIRPLCLCKGLGKHIAMLERELTAMLMAAEFQIRPSPVEGDFEVRW